MEALPDDILLDITSRITWKDLVMLGATSHGMLSLSRRAVSDSMCIMAPADVSTYAVHELLRHACVFHLVDRNVYVSYVFEQLPSLKIDLGFSQCTSALHSFPGEWRNNIQKVVNVGNMVARIVVVVHLRVDPKPAIDEWVFSFSMSPPDCVSIGMDSGAVERVLYQITTPEERRIMSLALLASWFAHASATMGGRRLRSHAKMAWLPKEMPSLHEYVRAAQPAMDAFVDKK